MPAHATKAKVAELRAQMVACSPLRLEAWRRVWLVPRGHRRSLGRYRGIEVVYPADIADRCCQVAKRMRRGQPWQTVTFSLFAGGDGPPEETIRASYRWALTVEVPPDGDELDFAERGVDQLLSGYNPAEGPARATNVSVKGLEEAGLVARAGRVRMLRRAELAPGTGIRPPTNVCRCGR